MCRYSIRPPSMPKPRRVSRWPGAESLPSRAAGASVFDFEGYAGVRLEAFEQFAVQGRGRCPEATSHLVADVAGQAYGGFADHFRSGPVTRIAVSLHPRPERTALRSASFYDDVEESGFALFGRRALAGLGQHHLPEHRPRRAHGS